MENQDPGGLTVERTRQVVPLLADDCGDDGGSQDIDYACCCCCCGGEGPKKA